MTRCTHCSEIGGNDENMDSQIKRNRGKEDKFTPIKKQDPRSISSVTFPEHLSLLPTSANFHRPHP